MSKPLDLHSAVSAIANIPGVGTAIAAGMTVPSDGSVGFAPGCRFYHIDGSTPVTYRYINVGTRSSCQFVVEGLATQLPIVDTGGFTAQTTVEAALAEIYQHLLTTKAVIPIGIGGAILAAGTPMAAWADNASSNPGITLANSKAVGLRWNNNASQTAVWLPTIVIPQDFDNTANATLKVMASKVGATVGDATTFTIAAFNQVSAALHDADSDFGGATSAMTGNATSKTVQVVTLTLALADLPAAGGAISMSIKPTDGTLGTDDVIVHSMWIEYKRKLLTS